MFYMLGQNSYNPLRSRNMFSRILQSIPATFLLLLISVIAFYALQFEMMSVDKVALITGCLYIMCELICIVAALFQSLFCEKDIISICETLHCIEAYLCVQVRLIPNFSNFFKRYLHKVFLISSLFCLMAGSKFLSPREHASYWVEYQFIMIRMLVILPKMNALFFVSLLKSMIKFSNKFLVLNIPVVDIIQLNRSHTYISVIKHYKFIHFKLFTVTTQINETFGWSLVAICVETMYEIALMLYWTFYYWHKDGDEFVMIISK